MHRYPLFGIVRTRGQNIKLLTSLSFVLIFDKFCPVVFFHDWGGGGESLPPQTNYVPS